jgi:hypothetical protein
MDLLTLGPPLLEPSSAHTGQRLTDPPREACRCHLTCQPPLAALPPHRGHLSYLNKTNPRRFFLLYRRDFLDDTGTVPSFRRSSPAPSLQNGGSTFLLRRGGPASSLHLGDSNEEVEIPATCYSTPTTMRDLEPRRRSLPLRA